MDLFIQENVEQFLQKLGSPFRKIRVEKRDETTYRINIESEEPSLLIGHHGENIQAMQSLLRIMLWKQKPEEHINIVVDVDDYRKRQEENVLSLAERKADLVRQTNSSQSLPPMSPYFRRLIHLHLAEKYEGITTESVGEGDFRYLTIKPETPQEATV